jgi:hypothetical protein
VAYYHCVSRIVDRRFVLEAREREIFVRLMRGYESYCGVRIITFCVMSNHFHILLEVPRRPPVELLPTDAELVERLRKARCSFGAAVFQILCVGRVCSVPIFGGFNKLPFSGDHRPDCSQDNQSRQLRVNADQTPPCIRSLASLAFDTR